MAVASRPATSLLIGDELNNHGTPTNPTRKLVGTFTFQDVSPQEEFLGQNTGTYARAVRRAVPTSHRSVIGHFFPLDFEQILLMLSSGFNGRTAVEDSGVWSRKKTVKTTSSFSSGSVQLKVRGLKAKLPKVLVTNKLTVAKAASTGHKYPANTGFIANTALSSQSDSALDGTHEAYFPRSLVPDAALVQGSSIDVKYGTTPVTVTNVGVKVVEVLGEYIHCYLDKAMSGISGGGSDVTDVQIFSDYNLHDWVFSLKPALEAPVIESYTFWSALSDGYENYWMQSPYGFCSAFQISALDDGVPAVQATYQGRRAKHVDNIKDIEGKETGHLVQPFDTIVPSVPTDLNSGAALRSGVYIDNTWDDIGTTPVLATIKGSRFLFGSSYRAMTYQDERDDLDYSRVDFSERVGELDLDISVYPETDELFARLRDARDRGDMSFIQLLYQGANLNTPEDEDNSVTGAVYNPEYRRHFIIRMAGQQMGTSLSQLFRQEMGFQRGTLRFGSILDAVSGNDLEFVVRNQLSEWP